MWRGISACGFYGRHVFRTPSSVRTAVSRAAKQVSEPPQPPTDPQRGRQLAERLFPRFMTRYASRIYSAPASHITAFLLVHELSAIVPLFAVWGGLYYCDYVPVGLPDWLVERGSEFIRKMGERNNWTLVTSAESGSRIILQGAAAYAAVKALMPVRLVFSLWAMPWIARWFVIPITSRISRVVQRTKAKVPTP